ncbi:uncharacterized protein LOC128552438 [Mercenaria mercenaria]|uniref:uncharacterized protein LOC128552438 n=1 Tax=Mercenaria mercenaria TaxID=6596 RepID=UPI00234F0CF0|nr:uncharacterized protein LOC128552438 [Mercenaria mercenaria]
MKKLGAAGTAKFQCGLEEQTNTIPHPAELFLFRRSTPERISKWQTFIKEQDETGISSLIERGILPNKDDLDLACYKFGRRSQTFSNILTFTCKHIKSLSSNIFNVWTSYDTNELEKSGKIHIVFVVITECAASIPEEISRAYTICKRQKQETSMESKEILESRLSDVSQGKNGEITESILDKLSSCVTNNANYLMEKHNNINAICPNTKKSTGFGTPNHKIIDIPCITIYVHVKGLTPITEDPFPKQICGFQTDVTEEKLSLFHGGPHDYHNNLKMGTAIHANIRTPTGVLGGTLGCFLDHKQFGLCCITSSHFVLNAAEIRRIQNEDGSFDMRHLQRQVYQPCGVISDKFSFGQLISVVYREGDDSSPGVEAALIQIFRRPPMRGDFPDANNYADAGFDESHPLLFNSGNVCDVCHKHKHLIVYKFGISTGCTRGCLGLHGGSIRKTEVEEDTCVYKLRNQLEILPAGRTPFATEGDSGALLMIQDYANDSTAIGIVTGGFSNGTVFVTPICAILDAFGCPRSLKSFAETASLTDSGTSSMPEEMEGIASTLV